MTTQVVGPDPSAPVAMVGQVMSPATYAQLGGQLGQAGYTSLEISEIMGMIEREVTAAAMDAARKVALAITHQMVTRVQRTHEAACMEIYRRLANQTGGMGGVSIHRKCCQVAIDVGQMTPRMAPPAAHPIIGTPR